MHEPSPSERLAAATVAPLAHRTEGAVLRTGISRAQLYKLAKQGRIRPIKCGRSTLWPEAELQRLLDELAAAS